MVALALGINVQAGRQLHDVEVLLTTVPCSIHTALQLCLVNHLRNATSGSMRGLHRPALWVQMREHRCRCWRLSDGA